MNVSITPFPLSSSPPCSPAPPLTHIPRSTATSTTTPSPAQQSGAAAAPQAEAAAAAAPEVAAARPRPQRPSPPPCRLRRPRPPPRPRRPAVAVAVAARWPSTDSVEEMAGQGAPPVRVEAVARRAMTTTASACDAQVSHEHRVTNLGAVEESCRDDAEDNNVSSLVTNRSFASMYIACSYNTTVF